MGRADTKNKTQIDSQVNVTNLTVLGISTACIRAQSNAHTMNTGSRAQLTERT